jgi:hypothetical protein
VFIGYAEGSKAYRILDPGTQRVCTTRDVVFDEGQGWAWDKAVDDGSTPMYDNFTVEFVLFEGAGGLGSSLPPSRCRDWCLTIWRCSCILHATTVSLGLSQRPRQAAWRGAMQSEMDAVEKNRTWELADLPRGHSAIILKWVFKLKRDRQAQGSLGGTRFRAAGKHRLR